jgi:hypothetical protein
VVFSGRPVEGGLDTDRVVLLPFLFRLRISLFN